MLQPYVRSNTFVTNRWSLVLLLLILPAVLFLQSAQPSLDQPISTNPGPASTFGQLPLAFVPNLGQNNPAVHFQAGQGGGRLFFTPTEVVLTLPAAAASPADNPQAAVVRLGFAGANPTPTLTAAEPLPGVVNYFLGDDPARWRTNLPTYAGLVYQNLYEGIDLYYVGTAGMLKGTYVVKPGADPNRIRWYYDGASDVRLDAATGHLQIGLPAAGHQPLVEQAPIAWQDIAGQRRVVEVRYLLPEATAQAGIGTRTLIGFALGDYDPTQPLTIDPSLTYSALIGGSESDEGRDIAVDSAGNVYLTGSTLSADFPNAGAPQATYAGPPSGNFGDVFIAKLNSDGDALLYMTYLGGSGQEVGDAITVDADGNAYVTGMTESTNFPTAFAFQDDLGGADAFVTKLNAAGNALVFSTYLGGDAGENIGLLDVGTLTSSLGIAVDGNRNVYVTGSTESDNFPEVNAAFADRDFLADIFVTKFQPDGQALLYSTFLGGGGADRSGDIAVDNAGNAYVTGYTLSADFPTKNPLQAASTNPGPADVIVARFDTTQSGTNSFLYGTYLGGDGSDFGLSIALDSNGNIHLAGYTTSLNFPTQNALQATNASAGDPAPHDAFVAKLNPAGSALLYSTYFGGSDYDVAYAMDLDAQGNVYLTGVTTSDDFPLSEQIPAPFVDFRDIFVARLDPAQSGAASLIYSTLFGSQLNDYSYGLAVDGENNAYITGIGNGVVDESYPIQTIIGPADTGTGVLAVKFGPDPTRYIHLPLLLGQ